MKPYSYSPSFHVSSVITYLHQLNHQDKEIEKPTSQAQYNTPTAAEFNNVAKNAELTFDPEAYLCQLLIDAKSDRDSLLRIKVD